MSIKTVHDVASGAVGPAPLPLGWQVVEGLCRARLQVAPRRRRREVVGIGKMPIFASKKERPVGPPL